MQQSRNAAFDRTHNRVDTTPADLERPLSARSVMASLLLGRRPARASGRDLVRWCALFGITAGTARVALHRMVAAGELRRSDAGYELTGRLAGRQEEQEASLVPRTRAWRGRWRVAVVIAERRPAGERADLRRTLRGARLAEWREGVWLRPDNLAGLVEDPRCAWLDASPDEDPVALARRLFAPARWAGRAVELGERLHVVTDRLGARDEDTIAAAFVAGAAALRHVRADPLLPTPLLPQPWPGSALRAAYVAYQRSFTAAVREFFERARR